MTTVQGIHLRLCIFVAVVFGEKVTPSRGPAGDLVEIPVRLVPDDVPLGLSVGGDVRHEPGCVEPAVRSRVEPRRDKPLFKRFNLRACRWCHMHGYSHDRRHSVSSLLSHNQPQTEAVKPNVRMCVDERACICV